MIGGITIRQARILTQSAPEAQPVSGQVAADGIMQFNCAERSYREWNTTSIQKDGRRIEAAKPLPSRQFQPTRDGSFDRTLLEAACAMQGV